MGKDKHWSEKQEFGKGDWQFRFMFWIAGAAPYFVRFPVIAVVTFFFFLGARDERVLSRNFLIHAGKRATVFSVYLHFLSFSFSMFEKIAGWGNNVPLASIETQNDDIQKLVAELNEGHGAFLICSHLGNMEMLRSFTGFNNTHAARPFEVLPVVDFSGTVRFNTMLRQVNPGLIEKIIDANSIGPDTVISITEQVKNGNVVVIAGDRTAAKTRARSSEVSFLGKTAYFPQGAFTLAALVQAPVYFAFAVRKRDLDFRAPYEMHIFKAETSLNGPRKNRPEMLAALMKEYVAHLETLCVKHPYQWYNFYNFWEHPALEEKETV
ncbi:MAG: lipid A biosynthesis acyltransferase [Fibrobacter sp.]|jgi:predicted LPLAT superfamily acyltransferase|nr:lipid A biosynthesis acyltransferase [Fibrobacter sp.]